MEYSAEFCTRGLKIYLQETHSLLNDQDELIKDSGSDIEFSNGESNIRGVTILWLNTVNYIIKHKKKTPINESLLKTAEIK